jgi:phytoene synthase
MGGRSTTTIARACELGVAMQLTNIVRDIGEDARRGRIYLPLQWLREEGVDPECFLLSPEFDNQIARVTRRMLATADQLYRRAETGISALPRDCRASIMAARLIYADIGRVIARRGYDAIEQRAVVSSLRKSVLMGRALLAGLIAPQQDFLLQPLPAIRFLMDALPSGDTDAIRPDSLYAVIDLFERIAHRERAGRTLP